MLRNADVSAAIEAARARVAARAELDAVELARMLSRWATADIGQMIDFETGAIRKDMAPEVRQCIASVEFSTDSAGNPRCRLRLKDPAKAAALLAQHIPGFISRERSDIIVDPRAELARLLGVSVDELPSPAGD